MKEYKLLLTFLLMGLLSYSQDTTLYKAHNTGPLKWSDFQASPIEELDISGQLYQTRTNGFGNNDSIKGGFGMYTYQVYVAKNSSWYNPDTRNDESLLYFQTIFDINELHERYKEREINLKLSASRKTRGYLDTIEIIEVKHNRSEEIMTHRFKKAWLSEDDSLRQEWLDKVKKKLDSLPRVTGVEYERSNTGVAVYLSSGLQTNATTYHKYFGNQIEYFSVGFNFSHKKWLMDYRACIGGSEAKSNFTSPDFSFTKGEQINFGNFDLLIGRELFKYKKISFTPFVGGKFSQVNYYDDNTPFEGPYGYGYFGGGQLQYTWKEMPENIFSGVEFFVFYRGQYAQMYNLLANTEGSQISHSLGIGFNIFTLKVTEFK